MALFLLALPYTLPSELTNHFIEDRNIHSSYQTQMKVKPQVSMPVTGLTGLLRIHK